MAGNWKMNLDHLQATHLVQKLDWTLRDGKHDFGAVEVAVLPPFTDLRSVQTLIDGDRLQLRHGAQDLSRPRQRRLHRRDLRGVPGQARLHATCVVGHSERREYHGETDEVVNAKVQAAYRHGLTPIFCVGEGLEVRQAGEPRRARARAGRGRPRRRHRRAGHDHRRRLRAGVGHRHRRGRHARRTRRRSARRSAPSWPSSTPATWPTACACSTADRSRRPTSRRSWRRRTSTARSSAGRRSTPEEFASICRYRDHLRR